MTADASQQRIEAALVSASDTRVLQLGKRAIDEGGRIFTACFGSRPAVIVADPNTFAAAGQRVVDTLRAASINVAGPLILDEPDLHAHYHHVELLRQHISAADAIPVAVGSGTINDLTKLAAHLCDRPYMAVATAASMDGYTAFGASVTRDGSKQTFFCPAPAAVIADLDVICHAPPELNSAGYADLLAKVTAGADWIIADALGCEVDRKSTRLNSSH
jgi:glycerol-1-phosphate dehydrogenase [NAD(P)+]